MQTGFKANEILKLPEIGNNRIEEPSLLALVSPKGT
jgi:hypothetical protein